MDREKTKEILSIALGVLSLAAITGVLFQNGFSLDAIFSSVINFTQVAVPFLALLVATAIKRDAQTFLSVGYEALNDLQKASEQNRENAKNVWLMGPRSNRGSGETDDGDASKYLFITNDDSTSKRRAKFIPVNPLEDGELEIYVQKSTLVYGCNFKSKDATDDEIGKLRRSVGDSVKQYAAKEFGKCLIETPNDVKGLAIRVCFDQKISKKEYSRAILRCAKVALERIGEFKQTVRLDENVSG